MKQEAISFASEAVAERWVSVTIELAKNTIVW